MSLSQDALLSMLFLSHFFIFDCSTIGRCLCLYPLPRESFSSETAALFDNERPTNFQYPVISNLDSFCANNTTVARQRLELLIRVSLVGIFNTFQLTFITFCLSYWRFKATPSSFVNSLKNSMRATIESHGIDSDEFPPIKISMWTEDCCLS